MSFINTPFLVAILTFVAFLWLRRARRSDDRFAAKRVQLKLKTALEPHAQEPYLRLLNRLAGPLNLVALSRDARSLTLSVPPGHHLKCVWVLDHAIQAGKLPLAERVDHILP